jgi:hypothetical protein
MEGEDRRGEERCKIKHTPPRMEFFTISIALSAISLPISIRMTSNMLSRHRKRYNPIVKE